jgi:hypothetical protein
MRQRSTSCIRTVLEITVARSIAASLQRLTFSYLLLPSPLLLLLLLLVNRRAVYWRATHWNDRLAATGHLLQAIEKAAKHRARRDLGKAREDQLRMHQVTRHFLIVTRHLLRLVRVDLLYIEQQLLCCEFVLSHRSLLSQQLSALCACTNSCCTASLCSRAAL